jgi:cytidyltransferase-like protein|tara:strand:- start:16937 stop:17518 length:582 start_codon:yes stop_codon:yes gene_type:complete
MRVGIVAGSFKPYHKGHHKMVEIACKENDVVHVIVSLSDRNRVDQASVSGKQMEKVWNDHLVHILPENAKENLNLLPVGQTPVRIAYEMLEDAAESNSSNTFNIYSDPSDINRYNEKSLLNRMPKKFVEENIFRRPVSMTETHNVRGEDMRAWMTQRDKVSFLKALPEKLSTPAKESIWYTLVGPDAVSFAGC